MSKNKTMVRVSALAFLSAPFWIGTARAQSLNISCKQNIFVGKLIASGCSGKYIISPDGAHSNTACLIINSTAMPGTCLVKKGGKAATRSAIISFVKTAFSLSNTAVPGSVLMNNLRMKLRTQTPVVTKLTIGAATLNSKKNFIIDIGGTLNYSDGQVAGSYAGKVAVSVNFN